MDLRPIFVSCFFVFFLANIFKSLVENNLAVREVTYYAIFRKPM